MGNLRLTENRRFFNGKKSGKINGIKQCGGNMRQRYHILDEIRGITLCSMIAYHAVWDLVYMFGKNWTWYQSDFAYFWQQSICWTFILLSGFCFSIGKRKLRRGLIVFGAGAVISLVTEIFMPQNRIRFGVLTLLGSCMLIMALAEWLQEKGTNEGEKISVKTTEPLHSGEASHPILGITLSFAAFALTKRVNDGYLGFADVRIRELSKGLYKLGDFGNFLGFTERTFYSTDYFSLIPWFFLFLTGFYLHKYFVKRRWMEGLIKLPTLGKCWRPVGKHSLIIYMAHQPVIYGVLYFVYVILPTL